MADLFKGKKLIKKDGANFKDVDGDAALKEKVVALYFSAHWCPPCRMFTPVLKDFYEELSGQPFEIVFVSFDRSDADLKEYLKEAHGDWCFLPFGDAFIQELSTKYGVSGIPAMIVIKPNGDIVDKNGRGSVQGKDKAPTVALNEWKSACGI